MAFAGAIAALHLVLLLVASWMCYVSRHIPSKFSEGKYVSIAVVSNLQIFVVGVPVLIVVGSDPATSFFVRSVMVWMNDLVVVLLIFGNLIYTVSGLRDSDVRSSQITSAIKEFMELQEEAMNSSWHSGISLASSKSKLSRASQPVPRESHATPSKLVSFRLEDVNAAWKVEHNTVLPNYDHSSRSNTLSMSSSHCDAAFRESELTQASVISEKGGNVRNSSSSSALRPISGKTMLSDVMEMVSLAGDALDNSPPDPFTLHRSDSEETDHSNCSLQEEAPAVETQGIFSV